MSKPARVAVVGGGYMGGGIAQTYAAHGIDCMLVDVSAERSRERVEQLHDEARRFAADGLIPDQTADEIVALLDLAGPETRVCVPPEGPQTIPYVARSVAG